MTREPPLVTHPLSRPAAPPVTEHCQVLVCGDGMADENLCFFDVTEFYITDEVTVDLSEYAWCVEDVPEWKCKLPGTSSESCEGDEDRLLSATDTVVAAEEDSRIWKSSSKTTLDERRWG